MVGAGAGADFSLRSLDFWFSVCVCVGQFYLVRHVGMTGGRGTVIVRGLGGCL